MSFAFAKSSVSKYKSPPIVSRIWLGVILIAPESTVRSCAVSVDWKTAFPTQEKDGSKRGEYVIPILVALILATCSILFPSKVTVVVAGYVAHCDMSACICSSVTK